MSIKSFLFLFVILFCFQAQAQNWKQIGESLNGVAIDAYFGSSVSLSSNGMVMAVSARQNNVAGKDTLGISIFEHINENWVLVNENFNSEPTTEFAGYSLALNHNGSVIAIGAGYYSEEGYKSGLVRVFENNNGNWIQMGKDIKSEAEGDMFGSAVSLSYNGLVLAVGAPENNGGGNDSGHIRVFRFLEGNWIQIGEDIDGEAENNYLGYSVSLSADGNILATGADGNSENGFFAGHARVYKNTNGNWEQIGEDINGEAAMDYSGWCVSLSADGSIVAVSSDGSDGNGFLSGCVKVYENVTGTWAQLGQNIYGEGEYDRMGASLCLNADGHTLAIGAHRNSENGLYAGHVRIYKLFPFDKSWIQVGEDIDGNTEEGHFGNSVSISADGERVAIGASQNSENAQNSGQVRVFQLVLTNTEMQHRGKISFFPNPVNNTLFLTLKNSVKNPVIRIFDLNGKIIMEKKGAFFQEEMDLTELKSGVYVLNIQTDSETQSLSFIKK